jgi:MFS family permease
MRATPRLQRRFGLRATYAAGCLVYAAGFLLWGTISDPTVLSFATLLEGIGWGLVFTTSVVCVGKLVPASLYSTATSLQWMVGFGIGPIIGAGAGGWVYQHAGPGMLYACASAFASSAAAVAWFVLSVPALVRGETAEPAEPHSFP